MLIGLKMLLIHEEGFIPAGRMETYLPHMKAGGVYRLNNFFGSNNKTLYRVAEPSVTITFSSTSALSVLEDSSVCFPEDRFRFHGYEEFDAAYDLKGDIYDYVGHIKLVNGQVLNDSLVLDEAEIASTRRILLHAASDFSEKFKASGRTASVILVTTLNPKRFGGALALSSMTPSRVFMDSDVQATRDYLTWLNSNLDAANRVDADVVTKTETMTIGELFSYMKYLAKISVYDNNDRAFLCSLVMLANESVGDDHLVPVPQALINTIGKARKFIVKVSNHNLTGKTKSLTVTKKGVAEDGPSTGFEESDGERAADIVEAEEPKRAKCG
ncbi:hypothetical protein DY000_02061265 [Brassica cretica]|uniref:Uncharacterized protein n=1 Tax=Brassica cretica TaxID=69181 RepID=A0ABQ7ANU6_BRACR|nr:hypothetical protein DY000_02061265 [Brassica cretica]